MSPVGQNDDNDRRYGLGGLSRRDVLRGAGLGVGALYLAGCGGTSQKLATSSSSSSVKVASGVPGPPATGGQGNADCK